MKSFFTWYERIWLSSLIVVIIFSLIYFQINPGEHFYETTETTSCYDKNFNKIVGLTCEDTVFVQSEEWEDFAGFMLSVIVICSILFIISGIQLLRIGRG